MTATVEERILSRLEVIESLLFSKVTNWVPKKTLMILTDLSSPTIDNLVSAEKLVKKGRLYSYKSYLEHCGIKELVNAR